ncbi:hypothetical protein A2803_02155 [Candidatus Woesebacteria bacterium RIFCSPHIGHO2_01_FULL_44_21]|uniref:Uncharacterized protein n=1 Tax=Candidatus Woesebacteria bacterium RIFCSPHIGHO2_01_FULL_44_21 TaxID=1802503 RepID=A0A1F7YW71_9BACT|nr:MAG: hypothetical protein A2803_02155 [Candidatus Woesebacteria bacterium RIFCSPHIGHO2_01_FULL_44_21]OGM69484.1 MAG: hypothetical protein A2897_03990 [Candidatus Woesebacteria bacterium RIFCSPLOWO2_01_FULL_44_24b]
MAESKISGDLPLILYTDTVNITANKNGVVMNFMQKFRGTKRIISRIGMSREHAREVVEELAKLMIMTEDKGKTSKELN